MSSKVYRPWLGVALSPSTGKLPCMIDEGIVATFDGDEYVRVGETLSPRTHEWHDSREVAVMSLRDKLRAAALRLVQQADEVK